MSNTASSIVWPVHGDYVVVTTLEGKDTYGWFNDTKSTDTTMAIVPDRGATRHIPISQIYNWHHYWGNH